MKNMRISKKLIVSFLIVIVLAVLIGAIGIVGMRQITTADTELYVVQTKPMPDIAKVLEYSQRLRVGMRNCILYVGDDTKLSETETTLNSTFTAFETHLAAYDAAIVDPDARKAYDEAKDLYQNHYKPAVLSILSGAKAGADAGELLGIMEAATAETNKMVENFSACMEIKVQAASDASDGNDALAATMLVIIIVFLVISVIIALLLAAYIARLIGRPVTFMKDMLLRVGTKGELDFSDSEYRQLEEYAKTRDEVGESIGVLLTTVRRLSDVGHALETVAAGDLRPEVSLLSEHDMMGISLKKMVDNLNNMFGEINISTSQVSAGSKQIADGAQALAQGSTEQASAVEQLSSSISEIAHKTRENSEMADKASDLANTIKQNAEKGSRQMDQMMEAVKEINQASQSIGKVIKVIDDIAFQTNILALNAAVEAARAGQHGKGFAVVAEEVRNLAAKSAAAAKDTGGLIANSIEKAELGSRIADETAVSLAEIVSGINESTRIVGDIAKSSEEQTTGIEQVNKGIDQVAQVVQQNSATAEESAAASEEMSGQANMLEELVAQFKLRDSGSRRSISAPVTAPKKLSMPEKTTYVPTDSGEFGKY